MKGTLENFIMHFERKRWGMILNNRKHLTDFEVDQLIPDLKNRLEILKTYFKGIIKFCDVQENSKVFSESVIKVINEFKFQSDCNSPRDSIAKLFFNEIRTHSQEQGIDLIDKILFENQKIDTLKELVRFANEVNMFCSAMAIINNDLLLYKINTYPYLTNEITGEVIATHPRGYYLTIEPFQNYIHNIVEVSKATMGSIQEWNSSSQKLKTQYLDLYSQRLSLRNTRAILLINILAILLAVSFSAFFLTANDPFLLYKENKSLKNENIILKEKIENLIQR